MRKYYTVFWSTAKRNCSKEFPSVEEANAMLDNVSKRKATAFACLSEVDLDRRPQMKRIREIECKK